MSWHCIFVTYFYENIFLWTLTPIVSLATVFMQNKTLERTDWHGDSYIKSIEKLNLTAISRIQNQWFTEELFNFVILHTYSGIRLFLNLFLQSPNHLFVLGLLTFQCLFYLPHSTLSLRPHWWLTLQLWLYTIMDGCNSCHSYSYIQNQLS